MALDDADYQEYRTRYGVPYPHPTSTPSPIPPPALSAFDDFNPPEQPSPRPGLPPVVPSTADYIQKGVSPSTQAIVEQRAAEDRGGPTMRDPSDPGSQPILREGQPSALGSAVATAKEWVTGRPSQQLGPLTQAEPSGETPSAPPKKAAEVATSNAPNLSDLSATGKEGPATPTKEPPTEQRGHRGGAKNKFVAGRQDEHPNITEKATIDPRYLVRLKETDPRLHDSIVAAATDAGISSWEYANLLYAATQIPPGEKRIGPAALTQEDVTRYQQEYPELFKDPQGNPIPATDPSTNLVLGAKKYRELRDYYGSGTPSSMVGYYLGQGRTDQLAMLDPAAQREHIPPAAQQFARNIISPDATPDDKAPQLSLNPSGTMTPTGIINAATQAARTGNIQIFTSYQADNAGRGMSSGDTWKYTEALAVGAMIAKGDFVGAQHARELIFQMSHVGTVQALMRARQLMGDDGKGDLQGAAHQLALAYYNAPDGGMGKIYVTNQGLMGQRFNEATGQKLGGMFPITPQRLDNMINMAQDPQTFLKTMREGQKLNAEIEHKHAQTEHEYAKIPETKAKTKLYEAQAAYEEQKPDLELTKSENVLTARILNLQKELAKGPNAAAEAKLLAAIDKEAQVYYPPNSIEGTPQELTPQQAREQDTWKDIRRHNPSVSGGRAREIAAGLRTGAYVPHVITEGQYKGAGIIADKNGRDTGVVLSPGVVRLHVTAPAPEKATPASPIGATPQPAQPAAAR